MCFSENGGYFQFGKIFFKNTEKIITIDCSIQTWDKFYRIPLTNVMIDQ